MSRVAVVGSINMDLVVRAPRFPAGGETILRPRVRDDPRRQGRQSGRGRAAPRRECGLIGRVGGDPFGAALRQNLAREGIVTDGVVTDPAQATESR